MQLKPVFLKLGSDWININLITRLVMDDAKKIADIFCGEVAVIKGSKEAYQFFTKHDAGWYFTVDPTAL
jgi:hypothetical protein